MISYILITISYSSSVVAGEIVRHKNQFFAAFTEVYSNMKMTDEYILATFQEKDLKDCVMSCIKNKKCKSFSHNKYSNACELMNSATLVTREVLVRKNGWNFYETDASKKNNGHFCEAVSPCPETHVCKDTFSRPPGYICLCEEGFEGTKCQNYNGPGKSSSVPARSCYLLQRKHKNIPNGFYWLKNKDGNPAKQIFCDMRHRAGLDSISGDWNTVYTSGHRQEIEISTTGRVEIKSAGGFQNIASSLIPSDNEQIFPSSDGWFKVDNMYNSDDLWEYIRFTDAGTLEHQHFSRHYRETYKGIANYCCSGVSKRKN